MIKAVLACNFVKKEPLAQVFSCEFCESSMNTFFTEHLRMTASGLKLANFWFTLTNGFTWSITTELLRLVPLLVWEEILSRRTKQLQTLSLELLSLLELLLESIQLPISFLLMFLPLPWETHYPYSDQYPKVPMCRSMTRYCQCSKPVPVRHFPIATGLYFLPYGKNSKLNNPEQQISIPQHIWKCTISTKDSHVSQNMFVWSKRSFFIIH